MGFFLTILFTFTHISPDAQLTYRRLNIKGKEEGGSFVKLIFSSGHWFIWDLKCLIKSTLSQSTILIYPILSLSYETPGKTFTFQLPTLFCFYYSLIPFLELKHTFLLKWTSILTSTASWKSTMVPKADPLCKELATCSPIISKTCLSTVFGIMLTANTGCIGTFNSATSVSNVVAKIDTTVINTSLKG